MLERRSEEVAVLVPKGQQEALSVWRHDESFVRDNLGIGNGNIDIIDECFRSYGRSWSQG